jgi:nicotinate-nucleotide adenylyltransferase
LRLAEEALEALGLALVRWVPTGQPGHRGQAVASAADRLAMLRAALAGHPGFGLDDGEFHIDGPTYTVNTLARLRGELGGRRPLAFLIGADQFLALETWKDWPHLFDLAHIAVAERPGHAVDPGRLPPALAKELARRAAPRLPGQPAGAIVRFAMTALDISSTAVRGLAASGRSARYLVPETVWNYIQSHRLYAKAPMASDEGKA